VTAQSWSEDAISSERASSIAWGNAPRTGCIRFAKPHRGEIKCNVLDSAPVGLIRGGVLLHRALPCAIDYALSELFMIVYNLPTTTGCQPTESDIPHPPRRVAVPLITRYMYHDCGTATRRMNGGHLVPWAVTHGYKRISATRLRGGGFPTTTGLSALSLTAMPLRG
jgi:hypothetical protein